VVVVAWAALSLGLAIRAFGNGVASRGANWNVEPVRIDLNRASLAELQLLPGLGPTRAEAVLLERVRRGPFRTIDDLCRVDGLGPGLIQQLARHASCEPLGPR
jgi:competence ComEA-like helix-hairpin-helix protein